MFRKFAVALLIVVIVMGLGWGVQAQDAEVYVLGAALPFTGSLGTFGQDFERGIELAVMQMNAELAAAGVNARFEMASADTEQTPEGAARAVQSIVQTTGAQVVVGPVTTSEVLGAKQFADENGVILVAPASSGVAGGIPGDNIFRVIYPPDVFASSAYASIALDRGYENMVVLYIDDPFGNGMVEGFAANYQAGGGGEVVSFGYAPGAPDLSSESVAISAELSGMGENTAFFCVCFLSDAQRFMQAAQIDPVLTAVDWMGIDAMTSEDILEDAGHAQLLAGAHFTALSIASESTPLTQLFIDSFTETFDKPPGPFTSYAFDAANIAMLTVLVAGNDGAAVKSMLPFVSNHYIGTAVQAFLDENGDQAIASYGILQINPDGAGFTEIGSYSGATDSITYYN